MTINWKKEVESRKDDLFKDLFDLLSVPSVREDEKATESAPVGPGPKAALLKFLEIGERDGFTTKNVDNLAGHIEYGSGDETLGIFGHVDVVPVGNGWNTDPFKPVIKDGKLFARGASDDKGPSVAAYYGLKIIKELGLPVTKRVRFIIGTDEESGWKCMDRYLQVEEKPDFGFSPDAEFPIINGEKGNTTIRLYFEGQNAGTYTLSSFQSGQRENMVPAEAFATVLVKDAAEAEQLKTNFELFVKEQPVIGEVTVDGTKVALKTLGKAAHAQEPRGGINAATYLATFLVDYDFGGDAKNYLETIAHFLHESSRAEKFGTAYTDEKMGDLTMNPGLFSFEDNQKENMVALNFRFPKGISPEDLEKAILGKVKNIKLKRGRTQEPHYVPVTDPLVATLLDVYEEHTGLKGHEQVIGGGTFGRLLDRGVAYGAMFPHSIDTMHQDNEFMAVDDIVNAAVIYADAIYRLIQPEK
ncbi:dipeptidase PepV [Vagococcus entomophilus]|uniref:Dipeptidase PepV n=1 Tax=Vagococcus entomophilus TaxID=1160095 RepID=A0A430AG96_9ENTE|nr:dipeptidase PepV [Vagococcus entomophilus]RSU06939.1 dipeptidase PepV [Vagococcus entomophilus]